VLKNRYASLTPREREVMALIITGRLNKRVGCELGITEATVKAHRGNVMRKMKARSLAELVQFGTRLDYGCRRLDGVGGSGGAWFLRSKLV
jgi:FixJ family two-component response regulator